MHTIPRIPSSTKKLFMWYKIKELHEEKLTNQQIAVRLHIHRTTVSRYLFMSEEEFQSSQSYCRRYTHILDAYKDFVHNELESSSDLSASQVHDHLKENFKDLPEVSEKSVYNFVMRIRNEYNIEKSTTERYFQKCLETAYGKYAQVDFGERYMKGEDGTYKKAYFFAMVLCRSRAKYIYFSSTPFNSSLAVYAHELAFQYYGGIPETIIYDQDKVFIFRENMGDYILTDTFGTYISHSSFRPLFCHKEDPQTKGKVENVVKYVKNNFLKGRKYKEIDLLNHEALEWLSRTGNGKVHAGTHQIPAEVLLVEREYLHPYCGKPKMPVVKMKQYAVRKDNTISYHGNYYCLPSNAYRNAKSFCYVEARDNQMLVYSQESGKIIAKHKIAVDKGKVIDTNNYHKTNEYKYPGLEKQIYNYIGKDEYIIEYFQSMRKDRPRYYCDSLRHIISEMKKVDVCILRDTIMEMLGENIYNVKVLSECALVKQFRKLNPKTPLPNDIKLNSSLMNYEMHVARSDINIYNKILS